MQLAEYEGVGETIMSDQERREYELREMLDVSFNGNVRDEHM